MENIDMREIVKSIHGMLQSRRNYYKNKLDNCYDFTAEMIAASRAKLDSPDVTHPADAFSAGFGGNYELICTFERGLASVYVVCSPKELSLTSDEFVDSLEDASRWLLKTNLILNEQIAKWTGTLTEPSGVSFIQHSQARFHLKAWIELKEAISIKSLPYYG